MCDYIFCFSHLDDKQMQLLKTEFFTKYGYFIFFLTRKNFDSFFNIEHINLKKILTGKYLLIRGVHNKSLSIIIDEIKSLLIYVDSNSINLSFFCLNYNNNYYFNDFFLLSNNYNVQNLYNNILLNIKHYNVLNLIIYYYSFYYFFFRIFSLNSLIVFNIFINSIYI
ncbi:hypothetical protein D3C87_1170190 [compost metagenome]|jgi:hypothetical protein